MADEQRQKDNGQAGSTVELDFPIVGIGASAGGIEAIKNFLENYPTDTDIALVIVQHKQPKPEHSMQQMYENMTSIPVKVIENHMTPERNTIYLNPGGFNVNLKKGKFTLNKISDDRAAQTIINNFFMSLAESQKISSIGILMSGSGTDGGNGLRAIKTEGGMTMVQEPSSARYPGMPENALKGVQADFVLPPAKMPEKLVDFIRHPYVADPKRTPEGRSYDEHDLQSIIKQIKQYVGHDFSGYKRETLLRRIDRRMAVNQFQNFREYLQYLTENPHELEELFHEMLIDVTRFFRDPGAFKFLRKNVLPDLLENHPEDEEIRIWSIGCSTGEEVYSLAILFKEVMHDLNKFIELKIFATDVDTRSLNVAREAVYPESIVDDVNEERLERYFVKTEDGYQVKSSLRNSVIFADHDVLKDPPYSDIDFVACRNLLIYLEQENQQKLLQSIHYALKPEGLLMTGPSESVGSESRLFSTVNLKWKIFQRKPGPRNREEMPLDFAINRATGVDEKIERRDRDLSTDFVQSTQRRLFEDFGPPALILDESHNIVQFFGDTDDYLTHSPGDVSFNVLEMTPDPLKSKLILLLNEVSEKHESQTEEDVIIDRNGDYLEFDITVSPVVDSQADKNYYLVIFHEQTTKDDRLTESELEEVDEDLDSEKVRQLKDELESTKDYLHQTIEQLESKNKQLHQKNNELQSLNEEYQSTNEELVTSQEELQSTNEELVTVNEKLEEKVEQLSHLNDDMNNILKAIDLPVIILDRDLEVKRFTPAVKETINLIDTDVGRPLSDIATKFSNVDFTQHARDVLDDLQPKNFETQDDDGNWFNVRILPYRTQDDIIDGVVLTLNDITDIKQAGKLRRLATILSDSNDAIILFDFEGTITHWNRGAEQMYGYSETEAVGKNIGELVPEDRSGEIENLITKVKEDGPVKSYRTQRKSSGGEIVDVWLTATGSVDNEGNLEAVCTTERNLDWLPGNPD